MAADTIPLRPQPLDVEIWSPSLEVSRAMLDAPYNVIAVHESNFGIANASLNRRHGASGHSGSFELVFAGWSQSQRSPWSQARRQDSVEKRAPESSTPTYIPDLQQVS